MPQNNQIGHHRAAFRRLSLTAFIGAQLALLTPGCGDLPDGPGAPGEDEVELVEDQLILPAPNNVRLWKDGVVPVCLDESHVRTRQEQIEGRAAHRQIMDAANNSWGRAARVSFVGCTDGPTSPKNKVLLVLRRHAHWGAIGGMAHLGAMRNNLVTIGYCSTSMPGANCTQNGTHVVDHNEWLRAVGIHEFGHVLGFVHEHKRKDVWATVVRWCPAVQAAGRKADPIEAGGRLLSNSYDHASIMNYCRDQDLNDRADEVWDSVIDRLSAQDKAGVAATYGRR